MDDWLAALEEDGCVLLPGVFEPAEAAGIRTALEEALARQAGQAPAIRGGEGSIYAARNVLQLWPPAAEVWQRGALLELLAGALGPGFGLVRVLYFDKPPGESWALPWHKDVTVAVRAHLDGSAFTHPTTKAGVPHVEAPVEVLREMLTARIHLDEVTAENGPLKVLPGSHRAGKELVLEGTPRVVHAAAGDVLVMRPLVAHSSGRSSPDTARHRRILHLEFAASPWLPDGYAWHTFLTVR
jgi:hypothetical protein